VTVVVGARDHLTPPRFAKEIARLIPGSELVVVPDAGHQLPFEAPKRLVSIIRLLAAPASVVNLRESEVEPGVPQTEKVVR
jgi:pimeloyl-ACP methyl ester carboxylesterase